MMKRMYLLPLLVGGLLLTGCAGSNSSSGSRGSTYRASLGSATHNDVLRIVNEALLLRYNYNLNRTVDTPEDVYFETEWRETAGLEDELSAGQAFNRTRIIITAKPANRSGGIMGSYRVSFRAESEVRRLGSNVWEEAPMSEQRQELVKEIADYIKQEFRTTFRNG